MMDLSDLWATAVDALPKESELVTMQERLAYAQVLATLSVAQELNHFAVGERPLAQALMDAAAGPPPVTPQVPTRVR